MDIDIRHIAKLSRLVIGEDKIAKFERDMQNIVAMVEQLPDTEGESATLDAANPMALRPDGAVSGKYTRDELLANAPQVQAGCLVVPKTVE